MDRPRRADLLLDRGWATAVTALRLPCGHYLSPVYTVDSIAGEVYHCIVDGHEFPAGVIDARRAELEELL